MFSFYNWNAIDKSFFIFAITVLTINTLITFITTFEIHQFDYTPFGLGLTLFITFMLWSVFSYSIIDFVVKKNKQKPL